LEGKKNITENRENPLSNALCNLTSVLLESCLSTNPFNELAINSWCLTHEKDHYFFLFSFIGGKLTLSKSITPGEKGVLNLILGQSHQTFSRWPVKVQFWLSTHSFRYEPGLVSPKQLPGGTAKMVVYVVYVYRVYTIFNCFTFRNSTSN